MESVNVEFQVKLAPSQSSIFCTTVPAYKMFRNTKCMTLYKTALKEILQNYFQSMSQFYTHHWQKKKREKNWLYIWNCTIITVSQRLCQRNLVKFNEIGSFSILEWIFFLNGFPSRFLKYKRRRNLITQRERSTIHRTTSNPELLIPPVSLPDGTDLPHA